MCGIVGYCGHAFADGQAALDRACKALAHRGPDDQGIWLNIEKSLGLGHCRLSILDLSPSGHQPMLSSDERLVLIMNGEIYNHRSLRDRLESEDYPANWRGHSDTEILLAAIQTWGLKKSLDQARGMFALALWDRQEKRLTLARDALGEKPLYYGKIGSRLVFASELKALLLWPGFDKSIDRQALGLYCQYGYFPAPYSLYQGIFKLPAGCLLQIRPDDPVEDFMPQPWWSLSQCFRDGKTNPFAGTTDEAAALLKDYFQQAVERQAIADVSLGSFLSGGIDSSLVTAILQQHNHQPVKTFCIGFDEDRYDESPHAARVAQHLGCDHQEIILTSTDTATVIPDLAEVYDEPFADASQIPAILISRLARSGITVALAGDGGDEIFGGYPRYGTALAMYRKLEYLQPRIRSGLARILASVINSDRGNKALDWMACGDLLELYDQRCRIWHDPTQILISDTLSNVGEAQEISAMPYLAAQGATDFLTEEEALAYTDCTVYLPDDLLVKLDRASMAASLETRLPFLDRDVISFAASLPWSMKNDGSKRKPLLRKILSSFLPSRLFERPKQGFTLPLAQWLRSDLREWAEDILSANSLHCQKLIRPDMAQLILREHLDGRRDHSQRLWALLMLQTGITR